MEFKSKLKSKLVFTYLILIFVIVLIFEISLIWGLREYYFGNVEQLLTHGINTAIEIYDSGLSDKSLENRAKVLLENEIIPDYVNAQIIDKKGNIIESTARFTHNEIIDSPDFIKSLNGEISTWKGRSKNTSEYIMAVSAPMYKNNYITGAIRFSTSIEDINSALYNLYIFGIFGGIIVIVIAFIISLIMAGNIVKPIEHLKTIANNYALRKFDEKAIIFSQDELGELSEAFNYMSEEIKNADALKNDFISSISHEIRTPLTSICAWSETLLEGGDEEEQKLGLEIIEKESKRLTGLVETLLDFSKLEADRLVPDMAYFDLKELIERTIKQFLPVAKQKKISINLKSEQNELIYLGDKYRLKQVFINVIDNAIKYSYNGGKIDITLEIDEVREKIYVKIIDEGEGIEELHLEKISTLFYKASEKKPGSGIGLAVSKKIIELHKGSLNISINEKTGASVKIILPLKKVG